jgi:HAD superfamily hydrolase (TIGR01458 family)
MNRAKKLGFLLDLDGVIYNDSQLIPGAPETIQWLRDQNIPFRFITNTTMRSRKGLCEKLEKFGIPVVKEEIFSAVYAATQYVRNSGKKSCHLLLCEDAKIEFSAFDLNNETPDFVIVGDLGDEMTFDLLNAAFQKLYYGAKLIALQKNRCWLSDRGMTLDAGAFVAMLEFAAQKTALVIGKPSPAFFQLALEDLQKPAENVIMVGDDIETDIIGAQQLGMRSVLVQTGKFQSGDMDKAAPPPWQTISTIAELPTIIDNLQK